MIAPQPKPEKRSTTKRRKADLERGIKWLVRVLCVERDSYCRVWLDAGVRVSPFRYVTRFGDCSGFSEWAHFGAHKRSKTRGQAPEQRHTTTGSLMLCAYHHREYDAHRLRITARTKRGCDGPLTYRRRA